MTRYDEAYMKTPAYNKPCPCGSGFKYKHCCLKRSSVVPVISDNFISPTSIADIVGQHMIQNRINAALTPTGRNHEYQSIAFLHSVVSRKAAFSIVSVEDATTIPDPRYRIHGKPIWVNDSLRDEMLPGMLSMLGFKWFNGVTYIEKVEYDVFSMSFDQAYRCLNMLHPNTEYRIQKSLLQRIATYEQFEYENDVDATELQIEYREALRDLMDYFKGAVQESEIRDLKVVNVAEITRRHEAEQIAEASKTTLRDALKRISELEFSTEELQSTVLEAKQARRKAEKTLRDRENASFEQLSITAAKRLEFDFPNLLPSVIRSISRAEADREIKKEDPNAAGDVVFNYVRAIEAQLRENLREQLGATEPSLGEMVKMVDDRKLLTRLPSQHIGKLYELTSYRNPVSHGKESDWKAVDRIRHILFDEKLLYYLNAWSSLK